jgi:uncharacterized membrane protein required for colicin V production
MDPILKMSLSLTVVALGFIVIFAFLGWRHGARRAAFLSGSIFCALMVVSLLGSDMVRMLANIGLKFHLVQKRDLFLAILFASIVYVVRLAASSLATGLPDRVITRKQMFFGALLGALNGFLLIASVMRFANPYLQTVIIAQTGGWTWHPLLLRVSEAHGSSVTFALKTSTLTITPSPVLNVYSSLPTALMLLFAFLMFVFVGTLYARTIPSRS